MPFNFEYASEPTFGQDVGSFDGGISDMGSGGGGGLAQDEYDLYARLAAATGLRTAYGAGDYAFPVMGGLGQMNTDASLEYPTTPEWYTSDNGQVKVAKPGNSGWVMQGTGFTQPGESGAYVDSYLQAGGANSLSPAQIAAMGWPDQPTGGLRDIMVTGNEDGAGWSSLGGFSGAMANPVSGAYNTEGGGGLSPELQAFMAEKGYTPGIWTGEGQKTRTQVFDKDGKPVGPQDSFSPDMDSEFGIAMALAASLAGGAGGGMLASGMGAAQGSLAAGALAGAGAGLGGGLATYGPTMDALKAAGMGAVGGSLTGGLNVANYAGIEDELYSKLINGAVQGGAKSALRGGNVLQGAAMGGLSSGGGKMWDDFWSTMSGGGSASGDGSVDWGFGGGGEGMSVPATDPNDWRSLFGSSGGMSMPSAPVGQSGSDILNSYAGIPDQPESDPYDQKFFAQGMGNLGNMGGGGAVLPSVSTNMGGSQGNGTGWQDYLKKNGGNLAAVLGSLYMGNKQRSQMSGARKAADKLYSPNSPYAKQLEQTLLRKDAASGRRSQYGNRATELAAQLSNMRSGQLMSPQYQQLMMGQQGGLAQMLGPLMQMYNRGGFQGLGGALTSGYDELSSLFGG